jgi:phosphoribosylglycinamide formyltransferase-1
MKKIAIFASGSGTNAESIINYFSGHKNINVELILSNKPDAFVLERAKKHQIPYTTFTKKELYENENVKNLLVDKQIDLIVLAGFLLLIPSYLVEAFPNRIINIHPALLPKYGGKGMYGKRVHQKVIDNKDKETGISIHYVNEKYDEGDIIHQEKCPVYATDTPESLAERVHQLEYRAYPRVIEQLLKNL